LQHQPSPFDVLDEIAHQLRTPPGPGAPAILVRYLDALAPADDVPPASTPHPLIITAALRGDHLVLAIDAADRAPASTLLVALASELTRVLRALADAAPRAPRPTDFAHVDLDAGELADLLEDLS
jgi:hypothetical protein